MIWFTWRQFRTRAAIAVVALAACGVALLITGRTLAQMYAGVASCQSDCGAALSQFGEQFRRDDLFLVYGLSSLLMYLVPALVGAFWGAPLIAHELETGTHRLAWNQTVTRSRWLASKLAVVGGTAAALTGVLGWAVSTWARHIDTAVFDRIEAPNFGARGIVPIGYAVFAFTLGVTCGMLIRRTVPAMAITLAGYAAVVLAMPLWLRAHLIPALHETRPLDLENLSSMITNTGEGGGTMELTGPGMPHAWNVSNLTITPAGDEFHGPPDPVACGEDAAANACDAWLTSLNLREDIIYHPASHFWALQAAETGILLGLAALLVMFSFWWVRRRLT
ncbi:MAG TPA: ABC transporter permease subunit [Candidatus Limnocylindrales bacterium]|nr:ABC transporter permease subunit [Candidatus Limnocylindrales bacterium]